MTDKSIKWTVESPDAVETERFGVLLGKLANPDLVIGLTGNLGAGKTCFIRGLAKGLGVPVETPVTSPTYVLVHEYEGRLPLYHFDAYRLQDPAQFAALGSDEYFYAGGVCVVEWADRVAEHLPAERVHVGIEHTGPTRRTFTVEATGNGVVAIASQWQARIHETTEIPGI